MCVSSDGNTLAVANEGTNIISLYFVDTGALLHSFGGPGGAAGQFNSAKKLCFACNGNLLIAESSSRRVQEVTVDGTHVRFLSSFRPAITGELRAIAASREYVCVAKYENMPGNQVFLFDYASGSFVRGFGAFGSGDGKVKYCEGMCFTADGNHIVLAENSNNRLSMFTIGGEFVSSVAKGKVLSPQDVTIASNGNLVVPCKDTHSVSVYSPDGGSLLCTFGSGSALGPFVNPIGVVSVGSRVYVLDQASEHVQVFSDPSVRAL